MLDPVSKDPLKSVGRQVRARRQDLGLSQLDLASEADMDRTYLSGIERGERNLGLRNLFKLARALKTTPADLLAGLK